MKGNPGQKTKNLTFQMDLQSFHKIQRLCLSALFFRSFGVRGPVGEFVSSALIILVVCRHRTRQIKFMGEK